MSEERINQAIKSMSIQYKTKYGLPDSMWGGLEMYVRSGVIPGSFLTAVLSNDFSGAVLRADMPNTCLLREWAQFINNEIPHFAWGSQSRVIEWCNRGGMIGYLNSMGLDL